MITPLKEKKAPKFEALVKYLRFGMKTACELGREPKDFEHFVYELAMEAVYGEEYWDWYKENEIED